MCVCVLETFSPESHTARNIFPVGGLCEGACTHTHTHSHAHLQTHTHTRAGEHTQQQQQRRLSQASPAATLSPSHRRLLPHSSFISPPRTGETAPPPPPPPPLTPLPLYLRSPFSSLLSPPRRSLPNTHRHTHAHTPYLSPSRTSSLLFVSLVSCNLSPWTSPPLPILCLFPPVPPFFPSPFSPSILLFFLPLPSLGLLCSLF